MDDKEFIIYSQLEEFYEHDAESLNILKDLRKRPQSIEEYRVLRDNPIIKKLADDVYQKLLQSYDSLTDAKAWEMSDKERINHLQNIKWGRWFLYALGENPDILKQRFTNSLKVLAERAGIDIPKE